jgi:hypothetical protein
VIGGEIGTFLRTLYEVNQTLKLAQTSKVQSLRLSTRDTSMQPVGPGQQLAFQNKRIAEKTILSVKYIYDGRCYGMKINVGKTKVMRVSRQPSQYRL